MMKDWSRPQRNAAVAGISSWTLDAFDFFIFVFVLSHIADSFDESVSMISYGIMLTLATRPIGALLFGRAAEKWGRKPVLIVNIVLFSLFEMASGLAPGIISLLIIRTIYGLAMGGVWGVASSLALESVPQRSRGLVSGIFQAGYLMGYLIASIIYGLLFTLIGWRGLFLLGILPVLLAIWIYFKVEESPVWLNQRKQGKSDINLLHLIKSNWHFCVTAAILMAAFNFFSHGTQDIYPTFLEEQHELGAHAVGFIAICYNIAGIISGVVFGNFSQKIGRRNAMIIASLLSLVMVYPWAYAQGLVWLTLSAVSMMFMVQGAWSAIPAYLTELAPVGSRAILPGFIYQVGNFIAAVNGPLQTTIAEGNGGNYSLALISVAAPVAIIIIILLFLFGRDTRHVDLAKTS